MISNAVRRAVLVVCAATLCTLLPSTAHAQLRGRIAVGASIVHVQPASDGLDTKVRVVPTISRVPRKGWGPVGALNWFEADVNGDFVGLDQDIGKVRVRPLMGGIGYTFVNDKFSITPSIVGGPAWNRLKVDGDLTDVVAVRAGDDDFDDSASKVTFAIRPGISATYAFRPRFGVTAFAGYLINRPKFDVLAPTGQIETPWKTDAFSVSVGVVVPIF